MKDPCDEMENPCDECLVQTVCCRMCDRAKPFFMNLMTEDPHFNWTAYEKRRDQIYDQLIRESQKDEEYEEARKLAGISETDDTDYSFWEIPLQERKEIEDAKRTRTSTGAEVLRKIKHFCFNYFKDKRVDIEDIINNWKKE